MSLKLNGPPVASLTLQCTCSHYLVCGVIVSWKLWEISVRVRDQGGESDPGHTLLVHCSPPQQTQWEWRYSQRHILQWWVLLRGGSLEWTGEAPVIWSV